MAGTNAVEAKRALVALCEALPALEGVQVTYDWPVEPQRERVRCGRARWTSPPMAFQASGQRIPRDEQLTVDLIVEVIGPGMSVEDAEARVVEIGTAIEEGLALDPKMASAPRTPPGLLAAFVDGGGELDSDFDDDDTGARIIYQVNFRSELT